MKKQLFLMSALALTALASCGGTGKQYTPGTPLKVGLICLHDKSSTYDANFIKAFETASEQAKKDGKVSEYIVKTGVDESQACGDAAKQLVNQGCNIIFSDSFGHDPFMKQAAIDNPNVVFSSATGVLARNGGVQNYHNSFASIYAGRYLAGYAAGLYMYNKMQNIMDKEIAEFGKFYVGYVGAYDYAEVISGYTSWFLGLREALSDTKYAGKSEMIVRYTNSWYDEQAEKSTALTLIDTDKCILISQHADSMGAPNACKEKNVPDISYNISTIEMGGDTYSPTYLGYSKIDWAPYYTEVINKTYQGRAIEEKDRNWTGTLATGSVRYELNPAHFSADDMDYINLEEAALTSDIKWVFDTAKFTVTKSGRNKDKNIVLDGDETKTTGHLTSYFADVTGDYVPDTDCQMIGTNGLYNYVRESYYRSAPSFDLIIDGITEKIAQ